MATTHHSQSKIRADLDNPRKIRNHSKLLPNRGNQSNDQKAHHQVWQLSWSMIVVMKMVMMILMMMIVDNDNNDDKMSMSMIMILMMMMMMVMYDTNDDDNYDKCMYDSLIDYNNSQIWSWLSWIIITCLELNEIYWYVFRN